MIMVMMAMIMEAMTVVLRNGESGSVLHGTKMIKDRHRKSLQHKIPFPPNGTKRKRKIKCYTQNTAKASASYLYKYIT